MNEKYGIELELITNKFKEKIEQVKNAFKGIENARIDMSKQVKIESLKREFELASNQAEALRHKLKLLKTELSKKQQWEIGTKSYTKLQNEIDKTTLQFEKASIKVDNLNDKLNLLESNNSFKKLQKEAKSFNEMNKGVNQLTKGIDKVTSKIKRFALSLFSIRSIYALVSKASSAYLTQDTTLANKLQSVWVGLGAMLEPIISAIANTMIKAVKYINIFVKALTGVDLLAKAMKKSLGGANKSAKALSKTLAGFDELNNLDTTTDASNVNTGGSLDSFKDVEIDTSWADKIKVFGEWLRKNWKPIVIAIGAVTGALLFLKLKSSNPSEAIKQVGTSFTGLFNGLGKAAGAIAVLGGLALVIGQVSELITAFSESGLSLGDVAILLGSVLGELAIAFTTIAAATKLMDWKGIAGATIILAGFAVIINQVSKLLKVFSETGMTVGDVTGLMASIFGTLVVLMGAVALIGPAMTAGLVPFSIVVAGISALLLVMAETIPTILEACSKFITNTAPSIKSILQTIGNLITNIIYALGTVLPPIINSVGNLFDKIFNGISKVISTVGDTIVKILNTAKSLITTVLSSILTFINKLGPAINKFVDDAIKAVTKLINFVVSGIEYLVNTVVVGGVNKIIRAINSISEYVGITIPTVSKMSIPRFVPKLDVGTNYVPEDQLAYIHKGEAVVPKKFNSQEYFGRGNDETNSLLEQVIEAINNIEVNPYTTIRDVGQTAVNYINGKTRQYGRSVI